jgi:hypothetical protein
LKSFIRRNLCDRTFLSYKSGRTTTNPHLAAIIKMGMALKQMTHEDAVRYDDEERKEDESS